VASGVVEETVLEKFNAKTQRCKDAKRVFLAAVQRSRPFCVANTLEEKTGRDKSRE
jgi:hypothetical protein